MIRRPYLSLVLTGLLLALGCEVTNVLDAEPDFGDGYQVLTNNQTVAPRLDAEGLHVTVQYGGGCADHDFELRTRIRQNTTEFWFEHDANGDMCEALLSETLRRDVPARLLEQPNVVLLLPDGTAYPLR